ncbi:MAG TPA: hypothetical protein VGI74_08140 [Streptosporangiaceae bacterium]
MKHAENAMTAEVEDRFRAASHALTERFPDGSMPPLQLPAQPVRTPAGRELWRRTRAWLIPLAAATAVIVAIATSLAIAGPAIRKTNGQLAVAPASGPEETPPYFVTSTGGSQANVIVGSTATGQTLATVKPPRPYTSLMTLAGSADDRSFLIGEPLVRGGLNLALLHIDPENGRVKLTQLRINVIPKAFCSLALAPDGDELAVAYDPVCDSGRPAQSMLRIQIYNLNTGATRPWFSEQDIGNPTGAFNQSVLVSWGNDRILGYNWLSGTNHMPYYSRFDTTAPGGHFSTNGMQLPGKTLQAILIANGTVVTANAVGGITEIVSSAATMTPVYPGPQIYKAILWANATGSVLIAQQRTAKARIGVIGHGKFIPLPIPAHGQPVLW